jgi:hypothetical protein
MLKLNDVSGGLLVEADHVACRIAEARGDLGGVRANRLHDLAAMDYNGVNSGGHTIDIDVKQEARLRGGRAPKHPRAAYFAGGIVKSRSAIAAFADVQPKTAL